MIIWYDMMFFKNNLFIEKKGCILGSVGFAMLKCKKQNHVGLCSKNKKNKLLKPVSFFGLSLLAFSVQAVNMTDINGLIDQVVATHPLVVAAQAEEKATSEGVVAAKLNMLPKPNLSSNYDKDDGMVSRASLRQPLWTGGKLKANINQAIYDDKAAMAYVYEQQNTVAKNTIDIWRGYVYAIALQQLYVDSLKQLAEFEAMMKRRVEQGVSAKIDLELVTNRILQDQNAYQGAVQQQRIAEARLSQLLGEDITGKHAPNISLAQMARYVKAQSGNFESLAFSQSGINNPSVIKQQFQIEAAKQGVKSQQASRFPTVYAQYEYVYYHKGKKENDDQFSVGLDYDPGSGFSNMALARASQARVQGLEQSQEAVRRTVMEGIQTQFQEFVNAKDQELSLVSAVAGSQIVVDSYRRQFIAGRKSWLEVLNAVREKSGYEQQLLQIQSQMIASFYKLEVDFGLMPWQNFSTVQQPTEEYRPYVQFQEWIKYQKDEIIKKLDKSDESQNPPSLISDETTTDEMSNREITPLQTLKIVEQPTDNATQTPNPLTTDALPKISQESPAPLSEDISQIGGEVAADNVVNDMVSQAVLVDTPVAIENDQHQSHKTTISVPQVTLDTILANIDAQPNLLPIKKNGAE